MVLVCWKAKGRDIIFTKIRKPKFRPVAIGFACIALHYSFADLFVSEHLGHFCISSATSRIALTVSPFLLPTLRQMVSAAGK